MLDREDPGEDASDIPVDQRRALAERDRRDRAGGVGTDASHVAQLARAPGQFTGPLRIERLRARMQVARARVVAEAGPRGEDVVERRGRERGDRREALHPALPVRDHRRDAGLLQHDLADPDRVRIARPSPRQVAPHHREVRDDRARGGDQIHSPSIATQEQSWPVPKPWM